MMLVKIHENGEVIAICDSELIGKKFEKDLLQLDVSERFYRGEEKSKEMILNLVADAKTINIVGEKSIKFAIENNIISKDNVIYIENVPHAQVFKL